MKPEYLEISAWGPYRDKVSIDFNKLGNKGIFLITGATGAGKTTIFDAICFALYGNVSGQVREKDSVRSDFASPDTKTYVKLIFKHKNKRYEIFRNPKYLRPRIKGTGDTTESENAILVLEDGKTYEGIMKVNPIVEELLCLSYSQFKQISMIAQGEYQKLLTSGSKERTEIFRNIFNTQLYEKMQVVLSKRTKELRLKITELKNKADEAIHSLEAGNEELGELLENDSYNYEKIIKYLKERAVYVSKEEKMLKKQLENIENTIKTRIVELNNMKHMQKLFEEFDKANEEILKLEGEKINVQNKERRLIRIRGAQNVKPFEVEYNAERRSLEDAAEEIEKTSTELTALNVNYNNILERYIKREEIEKEKQELDIKLNELKQLNDLTSELEAENIRLNSLQEDYIKAERLAGEKNKEYIENDKLFRRAAIGLAAKYLVEGEPCPVCGSLEHPHIAKLSENVPDEGLVNKLKKDYEKLHQDAVKIGEMAAVSLGRSESIKNSMLKLNMNCDKEYNNNKLKQIIKETESKQGKLNESYNNIVKEYNDINIKIENRKAVLDRAKENKKKIEKQLVSKLKAYEESLKTNEFESEEKFKELEGELELADKLFESIKLYNEKYKSMKDNLERLKKELLYKKRPDTHSLIKLIDEAENKKKILAREREQLLTESNSVKKVLVSLNDKVEKKLLLETEYGKVSDIEKITKGENSQRLVFEQFVLINYFEDILRTANIRLNKMSAGRYELSRTKKVTDLRSKSSLEIEVLDNYTGRLRHVNTLSGGEAFKAALALALGTSDIIQNNSAGIEVDTLFVDEGFGSLDNESLEQAVGTLMSLAGNNTMIGIISHVVELKEQIDKQIRIERTSTGSKIFVYS